MASKTLEDYTTFIPTGDQLIAVSVKILPRKVNKNGLVKWRQLCQQGQKIARKKKLTENQVLKAIYQRRYGETSSGF